ncbi:Protein NPG1 [Camellia lanceoleosa]|uniref:Protein NPG1 n=1 Tax=Camellia lanceoleosa TaxID=1840588 RepID=A0ACC0G2G9_9ERIC|nr:Protein NPG1 [Camellia lanceoleosa]
MYVGVEWADYMGVVTVWGCKFFNLTCDSEVYWLCEHTNIVNAKHGDKFPKFLRWDVGEMISRCQTLKLSDPNKFDVITDELVIQADEMAILEGRCLIGDVKVGLFEDDGVKETEVDGSGFARVNLEGRSYGKQCEGGVENDSWDAAYVIRYSDRGGVSGEGVEEGDGEFLRSDRSPKGHNSSEFVSPGSPHISNYDAGDSKIVMELKEEVERLKKKIEMQSINLVQGFESIFKVKDEECKKLVAENAELKRNLAALEEQIAEQAVHNVTQHFAGVNVTNSRVDEYGIGDTVEGDNGQEKCSIVEGGILVDASPVAYVPLVESNEMHVPIQADDSDVVVVSPMLTEGCSVVDGVNSFVRNIKGKVRKNLKLSGYEYPELRRRGRMMNNEVSLSKHGGVGCSVNVMQHEGVVDVENVGDAKKFFSSFGITNRNTVWKMMSKREKDVIRTAYERCGDSGVEYSLQWYLSNTVLQINDVVIVIVTLYALHICRAVMWVGRDDGNAVYFSDVRSLVRQLGVRGNVIDAFAELLSDEQKSLNAGKDFPDNSYFFSSICWDVLKGDSVEAKLNYVKSNLHAGMGARYMHFPLSHLGHWTLLVYDTEDGSWKHYNSMRSRSGTGGVHYAEAVKLHFGMVMELELIYSNWLLCDCVEKHCDRHSAASDGGERVGSAGCMDCAIIVCAVMRQYVNHVDVGRSLEGGNCSVLRADMVRKIIGDPVRGAMDVRSQCLLASYMYLKNAFAQCCGCAFARNSDATARPDLWNCSTLWLKAEKELIVHGRSKYEKGNVEGALSAFDGIDLHAAIQELQPLAEKQPSKKGRPSNEFVHSSSQQAASLVLEALYLKAKSLQKLGRVTVDNKLQEIVSGAVELLPELWKLDGRNHEAMFAYRRALLSQWNLDNDCCARIQKGFAIFLLYSGVEVGPPSLAVQIDGSYVPRNNLEEAILLLMILMRKFYLGKTKWDPLVIEHLTFALSLCSQTSVLAKQLEEIMPGVFNRVNRWKAMALCYSGAGQNKLAKVSSSDHERSRLQIDALKSLDEAIVLEHNNFDLIFELGVQYAERWNLNAALRYAKQFIDATGGSIPKGWRLLALILSAQQRFEVKWSPIRFR